MKKLINTPETMLAEALDGFAAAHSDILALGAERKFVWRSRLTPGKVAINARLRERRKREPQVG